MTIVPAILSNDEIEVTKALKSFRSLSRTLHIDILDNTLIEGRTLLPPYSLLLTPYSIIWHLMVLDPEPYFESCLKCQTAAIIIHSEIGEAKLISALNYLHNKHISAGIALNPNTPIEIIEHHLNKIDWLQIMTVEPGAQGHKFLADPLKKIASVSYYRPRLKIAVDGGLNPQTIHHVLPYRPDMMIVGSYLKPGKDLEERWKKLNKYQI